MDDILSVHWGSVSDSFLEVVTLHEVWTGSTCQRLYCQRARLLKTPFPVNHLMGRKRRDKIAPTLPGHLMFFFCFWIKAIKIIDSKVSWLWYLVNDVCSNMHLTGLEEDLSGAFLYNFDSFIFKSTYASCTLDFLHSFKRLL